eukprot:280846-Hanusia_phi.AAC.2
MGQGRGEEKMQDSERMGEGDGTGADGARRARLGGDNEEEMIKRLQELEARMKKLEQGKEQGGGRGATARRSEKDKQKEEEEWATWTRRMKSARGEEERRQEIIRLMRTSLKLFGLQEVNLSHCHLSRVPNRLLSSFQQVQTLDISNNRICILPDSIRKMKMMKTLRSSNNFLTSLPCGLFELKQLVSLDISHNHVSWISADVTRLKSLEVFDASDNKIVSLSSSLFDLEKLQQLRLRNNHLPSSLQRTFDRDCSSHAHVLSLRNLFMKLSTASYQVESLIQAEQQDSQDRVVLDQDGRKAPGHRLSTCAQLLLTQLLLQQQCDCYIRAGAGAGAGAGFQVGVHSAVLFCRCPTLFDMLSLERERRKGEEDETVIFLQQARGEVVVLLVWYLYTDSIVIPNHLAFSLSSLSPSSSSPLSSPISVMTAHALGQLAELLSLPGLLSSCRQIYSKSLLPFSRVLLRSFDLPEAVEQQVLQDQGPRLASLFEHEVLGLLDLPLELSLSSVQLPCSDGLLYSHPFLLVRISDLVRVCVAIQEEERRGRLDISFPEDVSCLISKKELLKLLKFALGLGEEDVIASCKLGGRECSVDTVVKVEAMMNLM